MRLKQCIFAFVAMLLCAFSANAQGGSVAKIGDTEYTTFADAMAAANATTGDVTIEVYDKVTLNTAFSGSYSSINFVGKDTDAEIYLDVQGYITATGKKVSFTDLTLSKSAGGYITNAGFMNVAFGIYDVVEVAYTNCVFANGAYASSGNVTFNDCTFYRSHDKYGLWAYGNVDVAVEGCTFADYRGIKMYAEGAAKTVDLTVKDTDFSAVTDKPAIVLTYGESVVLEGNTYSSTGTFELDLDGAPNGTAVTSDVAPTCKNDNGTCGVLVDGKIYTTVAQAAAVAEEGSNVTLLYSTTDAVEFAEGVNLTLANGVTADNVTVATSGVAKIGDTTYATLSAAFAAVTDDAQTVVVLQDVTEELTGAYLRGNITTENGAKVTINLTNSDWVYCPYTFVLGENITLNVPALFYYAGGAQINGAVITEAYYQRYAGTKLTINEPGSLTVTTEMFYIRYTDNDANAGIYVNGDNNDETVGLNLSVAYFYQGMIYAKDANIKTSVYWQTNETDGQGSANLVLDNSTLNVTVNEHNFKATGNSTVTLTNGSSIVVAGAFETGSNTEVSVDATSSIQDANGPVVIPVAKVGDVKYATLAEAVAAAQADDEIVLLSDVAEDAILPAGVKFNGNGKAVGNLTAGGEITFTGVTKATSFGVQYINTTVNIVPGACLEITGTGRMVIGHGCTFNITGSIEDAKTADVAALTPSLIMPGASFTGAGVTFNVTDAYIKAPSSYCSSSSSASGTFDFNIKNSIWESAGKLAFESQSVNATVYFDLEESVLNTGSHLIFGVSRGEVVIDNSNVNVGTSRQIENQSTMTIKNGSVVNGAVATSSNAKNPGTIIVEDATYAVTGEFSGSDLGTGTLIVNKGATVSAGSITKANIQIDATGMAAGDEVNLTADLSKLVGTIEVINNDNLDASIVDGKIVLVAVIMPVAKIGEQGYETLAAALAAAQDGDVVTLVWADGDAPIAMNGSVFGKNVTITGTATVDWSKGFLFVGRGGEGNATVTFDGANLTSASDQASTGIHVSGREKGTNNKYDGTLVIKNSTIELDYLINKNTMSLDNSTLTVKNGFSIGGRPASETESGADATATISLANNSKVIVNNHNGMGLGYEAIGVMNIDATSTFEATQAFLVTAKGTMNVAAGGAVSVNGTLTVDGTLVSAGNIAATIAAGTGATIEISGGVYTQDVNEWCVDGYAALQNLDGNYVVGVKPTATVNNLGMTTVAAGDYSIWNGSFDQNTEDDGDMPLSFVMQFLADQDAEDMDESPYADWYGDFVITFTGLENGSFTADGCYLAGHYGSFGWVKVPVDGMKIEEGARYPVMLGVGMGQKYNYICSSVEDFKCALYLTPEILEANPNIQVKLELAVVDNSKGSDAAASALINNDKVYSVTEYTYDADDFVAPKDPEVVDGKIEFVDGEFNSYTNDTDIENVEITYKRTIDSDWNALYVPFAIPASELLADFDIAYINDVRETDADDDGELDGWQMELIKIKKETAVLRANHPYFVRSKSADYTENNLSLTLTTTLYKATVAEVNCSSMYSTYTIKGLNELRASTEFGDADRVLGYDNGETTWGKMADGYSLKPFRFYLTITNHDGSPVVSSSAQMSIVVRDEDGTTGIDGIYGDENGETVIFDLYGRRVLEPEKGNIYIINGKKVLVK